MKQNLGLVLKLIVLMILPVVSVFFFVRESYFTAVLIGIAAIALAISILSTGRSAARRMEQMIAAIRYGDLNISFPEGARIKDGELNRAMNQALASFRSRLHEYVITEAETDAWQKLIRVLTHEIMNSLTPIISLSQTVLERSGEQRPDEKEYRILLEAMQAIRRRSSGLLEFVENYRRLTRISVPVKQFFPVADLFHSIRKIFSEQEGMLVFRTDPPEMRLHADRSLLEQVLINLIKNAIEASGGEIRVEAFRKEGRSVLRVSDNGSGIVPEALERIFIPFYTTKPKGSGIGLSLSRQIMSRHGGTLTVQSEPGKGSVFTMIW
ncbi:MAG: HAMP domain-containing histidine kinase [Culturomica sp.]|jgi:signal transduction histidine kinase|nr:HAMP domain-containing histidine kinase [Culturomica sp.]